MKVETKTTEKVTKEERVLTISESELQKLLSDSMEDVLSSDSKVSVHPMLKLLLTMSYAQLCGIIHSKMFGDEEEN